MPLYNPPPAPPEREPRWDERIRKHPAALVTTVVVAAMGGAEIIRVFLTTTLPWLLTFVEPLQQVLTPVVTFVGERSDSIAVGAMAGLLTVIALRWETRRRLGPEIAKTEEELRQMTARLAEMTAQLEEARQSRAFQ
jgi:hypothetical protein